MYTVPVPENKFSQQTRARLGEAVYLLGYLIQRANWETGTLLTTHSEIAERTGFPERTVKRWIQLLAGQGEITIRRTRGGTIITITDYAACARTRGVRTPRNPVQAAGGPNEQYERTISGPSKGSSAAREQSTGGPNNTLQNMYKTSVQNRLQNAILSILEGKRPESKRRGRRKGDLFDYTDPWEAKVADARTVLEKLEPGEREDLSVQAMEAISRDPRPFVRIFVKRGENGALVPASEYGAEAVIVRMAEILEQRAKNGETAEE